MHLPFGVHFKSHGSLIVPFLFLVELYIRIDGLKVIPHALRSRYMLERYAIIEYFEVIESVGHGQTLEPRTARERPAECIRNAVRDDNFR